MEQLCFLTNVSAESWAQLWGSIIGAIIGAGVALFAVHLTDRFERRRNREFGSLETRGRFAALLYIAERLHDAIFQALEAAKSENRKAAPFSERSSEELINSFLVPTRWLEQMTLKDLPLIHMVYVLDRLQGIARDAPKRSEELFSIIYSLGEAKTRYAILDNLRAEVEMIIDRIRTEQGEWKKSIVA